MTFSLVGPTGLTIDKDTGVVSWTSVLFADNGTIEITVDDGAAQAAFSPPVAICDCKNAGKIVKQRGLSKFKNLYV